MNTFASNLHLIVMQMIHNLPLALMLIAGLWAIQCVNWLLRYRLNYLGIYPRHLSGLIGIPLSSFLHASANHLMLNTLPLLALIVLALLNGRADFFIASVIIIVISGALTWLFARKGLHIGASGLIMGYFSYLIVSAYFSGTAFAIIVAFVCLYYFGSLLVNLFPGKKHISWEGHVFGFIAGLAASYLTPLLIPHYPLF